MYVYSVLVLSLIAGSPLVHAAQMGGYIKSMFQAPSPTSQKAATVDPRLLALWSSFHKLYDEFEHAATSTTSSPPASSASKVAPTTEIYSFPTNEVVSTTDVYFTIPGSEYYGPTPLPTGIVTIPEYQSSVSPYHPVNTTVVEMNKAQNVTALETSKGHNTTMPASTAKATKTTSTSKELGPTKVPPSYNGVSSNAAPVMGAVAIVFAGCVLF